MATYDMTSSGTATVGANSIAVLPSMKHGEAVRKIEAYLDFGKLVLDSGYTLATGDVFQLLEIPAGTIVLNAGAEVMTAFDGTATVDIDFAGGDDIVDGFNVTSVGFAAAGTNGQTNTIVGAAASTYTQFVSTTDTIDVTLASSNATVGVLRVYAHVMDCNEHGTVVVDVDRDQLA
ncbi:MAG: hypothetical protein COA78_20310 [Blastopirellula sp.]|nr:MAG: hypothetical protein COA78_20310 [Blastopirellula sp.]